MSSPLAAVDFLGHYFGAALLGRVRVGTTERSWSSDMGMWLDYMDGHPGEKLMMAYAWFDSLGSGIAEDDVSRVVARAIDLDVSGIVSDDVVQELRQAYPKSGVVVANGLQLFFKPSGTWEEDVYKLEAIGLRVQAKYGMHYDRGCHLTKEGLPAKAQCHTYRAPGGWASRRRAPVRFWLPLDLNDGGGLDEAAAGLAPMISTSFKKRASVGGRSGGSQDEVHDECRAIQSYRRRTGCTDAETIHAEVGCQHHTIVQIEFLLVRPDYDVTHRRGQEKVSPEKKAECSAIQQARERHQDKLSAVELMELVRPRHHTVADIKALLADPAYAIDGVNRTGRSVQDPYQRPCQPFGRITKRRMYLQKTNAVYAQVAWTYDALYVEGLTEDETVAATMTRPDFAGVRTHWKAAFGTKWEEKGEANVRQCYRKYSRGTQVSSRLLAAVLSTAQGLKKFSGPEVKVLGRSPRQIQAALSMLVADGKLTRTGTGRGTKWSWISTGATERFTPVNPVAYDELELKGRDVSFSPAVPLALPAPPVCLALPAPAVPNPLVRVYVLGLFSKTGRWMGGRHRAEGAWDKLIDVLSGAIRQGCQEFDAMAEASVFIDRTFGRRVEWEKKIRQRLEEWALEKVVERKWRRRIVQCGNIVFEASTWKHRHPEGDEAQAAIVRGWEKYYQRCYTTAQLQLKQCQKGAWTNSRPTNPHRLVPFK